ncbi:hypothetical protein A4X13_0g6368 [Tilletia indica]|uniref:Pseudouridine synthase n=1 Tax=Tilletia indica TaxID=43049 RepID=A0A177T9J3_9BASI|nr:hypothetical protein A4X13_0g6368 [Tilletia indica]
MSLPEGPPLRHCPPYWHVYQTSAKRRWYDRELLEMLVTEFRDRTKEYYHWAIHTGLCQVNHQKTDPRYCLKNGDVMSNRVHRHEPPVTTDPVKILFRDEEKGHLVVRKPGSIPVHAAGRYGKHTLIHMIKHDLNVPVIYTTNRLDRLTSGLMVCSTTKEAAQKIGDQFTRGLVRKAYVCRVKGCFPEEEIDCREPILAIDRQAGVNLVHPLGKECQTIFKRISYDADTDTSVVYCRPITGRTHQIRVHAQYLGYPIPNDPLYNHSIWEQYPATCFKEMEIEPERWKTEAGGMTGNQSADAVIAAIKLERDSKEDWARWRDEMLFSHLIRKEGLEAVEVPGANGQSVMDDPKYLLAGCPAGVGSGGPEMGDEGAAAGLEGKRAFDSGLGSFCEECKIPLHPDPKPSELYIYLHALKYETDEWSYEDEMPWWAKEDWRKGRAEE